MDMLHPRCCAIDVHKKQVTVAVRLTESGRSTTQVRTFGTFTKDLLEMSDWLESMGITHVAMESTGCYWRPVYRVLEGRFELVVANAQHVRNVPGRKTDVKDSEWLVQLLAHGLLSASFVPESAQLALRDLTRGRTMFVRQRATLANRIQKLLEECNIKLGSVASDVLGVSGRAMLEQLAQGQSDPKSLAQLALGKLKDKTAELEKALVGWVLPHQRILLGELLRQVNSLDSCVARLESEIEQLIHEESRLPFESGVEIAQTMPGIGLTSARTIISEIGTDMDRFATSERLAAWSGAAPANKQSAGKQLPGGKRHGNRHLLTCLVEWACSVIRMRHTYFYTLYRRIAARRGSRRALIAVAHAMLVALFHMLKNGSKYEERGSNYLECQNKERTITRLTRRLQELGCRVERSEVAQA